MESAVPVALSQLITSIGIIEADNFWKNIS
jgi:hypothetical protein